MAFDFSLVQNDDASAEQTKDAPSTRNEANPTIIKVIGCGGGGSSAIKRMIEANVQGVEFSVINTDLQALNNSPAPNKLAIGAKLTGGLGAGGNPEVGENAAREDADIIEAAVKGADMVFLTAGMGGGTGTGSIPIVAGLAKKAGALTIAVVTTPFGFEGSGRMKNAQEGLEKLRENVDSLIIIPNEHVFKVIDRKINFREAFQIADQLLCQGVQGISDIITKTGDINLDFKDVQSVMKEQGDALLGVGYGEGENRGIDAAQMAISNPMLENLKMDGATKILVNITGPNDLSIFEVQDIINTITASANPDNHIFWGQVIDSKMEDKVRVTVIATGFVSVKKDAVVESEPEPAPVVPKRDTNVVGANEFDDILHPTSFAPKEPEPEEPLFAAEKKEEPETHEGGSLGQDLFGGDFEKVSTTYKSQIVPPANVNQNDINQPAIWRTGNSNFGRSIDLRSN